jgi:hypothetical protein
MSIPVQHNMRQLATTAEENTSSLVQVCDDNIHATFNLLRYVRLPSMPVPNHPC